MTVVAGKTVVVTGIVPGESRITAEQRLRDAGAFVSGTVTGKTDLLITGAKVGAGKTSKAAALGVTVVPWEQVAWSADEGAAGLIYGSDGSIIGEKSMSDTVFLAPLLGVKQIAPMLCKNGDLPTGQEWSHEIKWDGYRCVATIKDGAVSLASRSAKTDYAAEFPVIAAELATLPDCVLDGEIIVIKNGEGGVFADLRGATKGTASYIVFDCIEVGRKDLRPEPLSERRIVVADVLTSGEKLGLVAQSPLFPDGQHLLEYCAQHGLEGVVSKRNTSRYEDGGRTGAWVKTKCRLEQEFVVIGYTEGEGRNASTFGALELGVYDDEGTLVYCGKVGTGWDDAERDRLYALLVARGTEKIATGVAVATQLVVQVEFQRWTADGVLWHPSYQGQRHDKDAADVRRES